MWIRNLFDSLNLGHTRRPIQSARRSPRVQRPTHGRLAVEALEDRLTPTAVFAIGDSTSLEGNSGTHTVAVVVTLSELHGNSVSVSYKTADGSATAGSDYTATSGTLTFAKGENSKSILVSVRGDRAVEANEAFSVLLSNAKGARIADATGVVTILDDEPRVSINDVYVSEGNAGTTSATFTVSLSAAYDLPVTVNYATADGTATAGSDYAVASGTLTFAPGQTSQTITVQVNGDRLVEQNETFLVNLTTPSGNAAISRGTGYGTIIDDEPQISIGDAYFYEGYGTSLTFTVSLSAADPDRAVTLNYVTVDGSAYAGVDYAFTSGTLTFAPGVTTMTLTVPLLGSATYDQYFTVQLSNASGNATIATGSAYGFLNYYNYGGGGYDYGGYGGGFGY